MNLILKIKKSLSTLNLSSSEIEAHGVSYLLELKNQEELAHQYLHYRQLLLKMNEAVNNEDYVILKGLNLIDTLYESRPIRPFSDLDLLVHAPETFKKIEQFLGSHGFHKNIQDEMSLHKSVWINNSGTQELVVELHRSLFGASVNTAPLALTKELMFVYLIYHLVYQHTFLRLIWLCDIYLFLQVHSLDHQLIKSYAKKMHLDSSVEMTFAALFKIFSYENKDFPVSRKIDKLISLKFLIAPKRNFFHYHLVKTLCKKSLADSMSYYLSWISSKIKI